RNGRRVFDHRAYRLALAAARGALRDRRPRTRHRQRWRDPTGAGLPRPRCLHIDEFDEGRRRSRHGRGRTLDGLPQNGGGKSGNRADAAMSVAHAAGTSAAGGRSVRKSDRHRYDWNVDGADRSRAAGHDDYDYGSDAHGRRVQNGHGGDSDDVNYGYANNDD